MNNHPFVLYALMAMLGTLGVACQPDQAEETTPGIVLEYMDTTVSPAEDFFLYANGSWIKNAEIPEDQGRWGSFNELRLKTDRNVLGLLEKAVASNAYDASTDQGKAVVFFQVAMDTTAIEEAGLAPIQPWIDKIDAIATLQDLQQYVIEQEPYGGSGLFSFGVSTDLKQSDINAAYIGPGRLGLPDRDYYTKTDDESLSIQQDYIAHIARMLTFLGTDESDPSREEEALRIYEFEKRIAEARLTKEERRNPNLRYNKMDVEGLRELTPIIDWEIYFDGIGLPPVDSFIVSEPAYMQELNAMLKEVPLSTFKSYLKWGIIDGAANYLNQEVVQANFDFFGKRLRGTPAMRPRDERVLQTLNWSLGEALGKLYVEEYFPPEAKEVAQNMVDDIKAAFGERIQQLEWMSDATKEKALEKLESFTVKIAYPDKWRDYSELEVKSWAEGGSFVENMLNLSKFSHAEDLEEVGKPVDKTRWGMAPQIVNAYYNPVNNEIVFPAAILQPPFYNYQADAAVNFGGIGAVIGHEISHGFDDQGSRYDAEGNLNNWWTDEDRERFDQRRQKLIEQYDSYEPLPGVKVNGTFTQGENIGDLGGINVAYDGLQRYLEREGRPGKIDGFTPEQRFFISWATIWRIKYRDETLKNQVKTDPHSPGMYRANGPLENMPAFHEAFGVKPGDPMYRDEDERVMIW